MNTATCISSNGGANGTVTANLTALDRHVDDRQDLHLHRERAEVRGLGPRQRHRRGPIVGSPAAPTAG